MWFDEETFYPRRSRNGRSPLHTAALNSRRKVVEFMLKLSEREEEMIHAKDSCGSTAVMDAVRGGDAAVIDALVAAVGRSSLEASRDAMGRNALHIAAHSGLGWSFLFAHAYTYM